MSCAQFKLDMFEGPLDLLLHLISKHKLNIHDIQISLLLEQYLEYIHELEHEDLEDAADFLEMAARLIYIKTVSLLPHDEEAQELKRELEGRLIEYSQCKLLAGILAKSYVGGDVFVRKPEPIPVDKTYTREHDAGILLDAYLGLSEKARSEKPINAKIFQPLVSHKVVSIGTKIVYILKRLYTCGVCDLSHIYDGMQSKSERVATFLAILELTKSGRIVLNDDNTQISFSDKSRERKKHQSGETAEQDTPLEQAAEKIETEPSAKLTDGIEQTQEIPEFKPDDSVHMPPEPKKAQTEKPKAPTRQATERIAYNVPPVLALPIIMAVQPEPAAQVEEIPTKDKPEKIVQVVEIQTEDKPEQTAAEIYSKPEVIEQPADESEPPQTAQTEQTEQQAEQPAPAQPQTDDLQTVTEENAEPAAVQTENSEQAQPQQAEETALGEEIALAEIMPEQADDTDIEIIPNVTESSDESGVPFKPNYWSALRYYWGNVQVGDDSPRNYWRWGSKRN